jgi:Rhodopirellula transposase DDE domain
MLYTQEAIEVFDHDFPTLAAGVVIPHGLYDIAQNIGYIVLGTSHDTSEFACECIIRWWQQHGKYAYPLATSLLLLCDGGGSNNARYYIFKDMLQRVAQVIGIEIRIAHYPPYTSKYNPIEHRLFPHLSRVCQGVIFTSVEIVCELMAKATTRTGLKVYATILDKVFKTGKKVADDFKTTMRIVFDEHLPQWNYVATLFDQENPEL